MHVLYQYTLTKLFKDSKNIFLYVSLYNILIYPALIIFMLHFISCALANKNPLDVEEIFYNTKSCYSAIFVFHFIIYLLSTYLGIAGGLLVTAIVYLKLPFVESSIFFNKKSLWNAIKESHNLTQDKLVFYMFILVASFSVLFSLVMKITMNIQPMLVNYDQVYIIISNILRMFIIFFAKTYLVSLYRVVTCDRVMHVRYT